MPIGVYERTDYHLNILAKARRLIVRKPLSEETKRKIGLLGIWALLDYDTQFPEIKESECKEFELTEVKK